MSRSPVCPPSPTDPEAPARSAGNDEDATLVAVSRWLDSRPASPPALRARIIDAIAQVPVSEPDLRPPELLAEASLVCLRAVLSAVPPKRASALDLLAADALLTYACEAAAEDSVTALEALARDYGPTKLAALLPEER